MVFVSFHACRKTTLTLLSLISFPPTWPIYDLIKTCAEVSVLDRCSDMINMSVLNELKKD